MSVILRCNTRSHAGRGQGGQYGLAREIGVSLLEFERKGGWPGILHGGRGDARVTCASNVPQNRRARGHDRATFPFVNSINTYPI